MRVRKFAVSLAGSSLSWWFTDSNAWAIALSLLSSRVHSWANPGSEQHAVLVLHCFPTSWCQDVILTRCHCGGNSHTGCAGPWRQVSIAWESSLLLKTARRPSSLGANSRVLYLFHAWAHSKWVFKSLWFLICQKAWQRTSKPDECGAFLVLMQLDELDLFSLLCCSHFQNTLFLKAADMLLRIGYTCSWLVMDQCPREHWQNKTKNVSLDQSFDQTEF